MRTALFLVAGLLLLGAALLLGKLFSSHYPGAMFVATVAYVALWFIVAGANTCVGAARAGYSVTEELPIFLLIFGAQAASRRPPRVRSLSRVSLCARNDV